MCGSKHSANWTTSRPSLPCSYSLLSNVLALFLHYTRPIKKKKKKLDDVGVFGLWFSECVCVCISRRVCACFLYVCLWGVLHSDVRSTSPESIISPLRPVIEALCLCKIKPISWQSRLTNEGTSEECSQHALQRDTHVQVAGVRLGVVTSVSVAVGWDLPTTHHQLQQTSGQLASPPSPQWDDHSGQMHSVDFLLSNWWVSVFTLKAASFIITQFLHEYGAAVKTLGSYFC